MAQHSKFLLKRTYREGRPGTEQPAVCTPEFHARLAALHWGRLITTMGVMNWPDEPEMRLGNCPLCNTTLTKPPKVASGIDGGAPSGLPSSR